MGGRRRALVAALAALLLLAIVALLLSQLGRRPSVPPAPAATPTPSPTPVLSPTATPSPVPLPATPTPVAARSIQELVDTALPGSTVVVPPGVYRETVTIAKPLTLTGSVGADIRGSDVWTDWRPTSEGWTSGAAVPRLESGATRACPDPLSRCRWPEQVFLDDRPLLQVAGAPTSGQFALDEDRRVLLADDPRGHTVEVTTRAQWLWLRSAGITVQGFRMRHAGSATQYGAIQNTLADNHTGFGDITIQDNDLSDAHGAAIAIKGSEARRASGVRLLRNDISRAGQIGVFTYYTSDLVVARNRVHDNNTEGYDPRWEAGGVKNVQAAALEIRDNEVYDNDGVGLWCDIDCGNATYSGNRAYDNQLAGIFFEIGDGARIVDNRAWSNGWGFPEWGWGAGILVAGSSNVEVARNTVAWNATGIAVISQQREEARWNLVKNVVVHDNAIAMAREATGANASLGLAWLQDWKGRLFESAANNRGARNSYWYPTAEGQTARFAWQQETPSLQDFRSTPGGEGSRYLATNEMDGLLRALGVPTSAAVLSAAGPGDG